MLGKQIRLTFFNQCIDQYNLLSNFDKILRSIHNQILLKLLVSTVK